MNSLLESNGLCIYFDRNNQENSGDEEPGYWYAWSEDPAERRPIVFNEVKNKWVNIENEDAIWDPILRIWK